MWVSKWRPALCVAWLGDDGEKLQSSHPRFWWAALDRAVNKRLLSTGEPGELASENVGFDPNPRVVCATPQDLPSNGRERFARKNLRNVGDTGGKRKSAAVNKTRPRSWGGDGLAPQKTWFPTTSPL